MAYIIVKTTMFGYSVNLWRDPHDSETSCHYIEVRTKQERDQLIARFLEQGHIEPEETNEQV